jgi:predicted sugar kinase
MPTSNQDGRRSVNSFYVSTATFFLLHCDEWDRVVALPRHKFVTLKRHTPDKFDQFLEDNLLTVRAISMTLCMKITVTIVLVLRYLPIA